MFRQCLYANLLLAMIASATASANTVVLTIDDLPTQVLDGMAHPSGLTFGFTIGGLSSTNATYRSPNGPGTTTYVSDPSIEAVSEGLLTFDFSLPTPILEFGIVFDTDVTINDAAVVKLYDASNALITTLGVDVSDLGFDYSEGKAIYSGTPLSRAEISFTNVPASTALVIDNIKFEATPEPTSLTLAGSLMGLAMGFRRRRL